MKQRALFVLIALATVAVAATTIPNILDGYYRQYHVDGVGEPPVAGIARIIHESPSATGILQVYDDDTQAVRDLTYADLPGQPFVVTGTITSAAAATAINLIPDSSIPSGRKVYVAGYTATVNGGTDWATTSSVKIQDTNASAVDFVTFTASELDANEIHIPGTTGDTLENAFKLGTGGTAGKGLQVKGNANGTGSNLVVTVFGIIK